MTDVAWKILERYRMMRELEHMRLERFKDLVADIVFDVLEDNEDGIYLMRFPTEKYDWDTVNSVFRCISDMLSSKKLVAIPTDISIRSISKEQARGIVEKLSKYVEE